MRRYQFGMAVCVCGCVCWNDGNWVLSGTHTSARARARACPYPVLLARLKNMIEVEQRS